MTSLLDPRFRLGYYSVRYDEDHHKNDYPEDILRMARQIYTSGSEISELDAANTELQSCIPNEFGSRMFKKPMTVLVTSIDDLDIYLRGAQEGPMTLPLLWWKSQEKTLPILSKMAMDYLAIPGTSISSKRYFSAASLLVTANDVHWGHAPFAQVAALGIGSNGRHVSSTLKSIHW